MVKRDLGRHYFREWRTYRQMSLAKAVARMEAEPGGEPLITSMSLSRIERGEQPYSEEVVNALAEVYQCEPWMLFVFNPLKDGKVIDLTRFARSLSEREAEKSLNILKTALGS